MVIGHNKEGEEKEAPLALPRSLAHLITVASLSQVLCARTVAVGYQIYRT